MDERVKEIEKGGLGNGMAKKFYWRSAGTTAEAYYHWIRKGYSGK